MIFRGALRIVSATSLPARIIVGAVLGLLAGVTLGDRAEVLQPIGAAYGRMLQIAVCSKSNSFAGTLN